MKASTLFKQIVISAIGSTVLFAPVSIQASTTEEVTNLRQELETGYRIDPQINFQDNNENLDRPEDSSPNIQTSGFLFFLLIVLLLLWLMEHPTDDDNDDDNGGGGTKKHIPVYPASIGSIGGGCGGGGGGC